MLELKVCCNVALSHFPNLSLCRIMCNGAHQPCRIDGHITDRDKTILQTAVSLRWSSESVFKAYRSACLPAAVLIGHVDAIAKKIGNARTEGLLQCSSQSFSKSIPLQDYVQWCSSAMSNRWPHHRS